MRAHAWLSLVLSLGLVGLVGCIKHKPGYCATNSDCGNRQHCDARTMKCVDDEVDGGRDATDASDAVAPAADANADGRPDAVDADDAASCASDAACPAKQNCNPSTFKCFSCTKNEDCPAAKPACSSGLCVTCTEDRFCGDAGVCDNRDGSATANTCVGCTGSASDAAATTASGLCSASKPVCDDRADAGTLNTCIECKTSQDCGDATRPICDTKTNTCIPCTKDTQCLDGAHTCLPTGECAATDRVIFVKVVAPTECKQGDTKGKSDGGFLRTGTEMAPYCAVSDAVADLREDKNVIVLRGDGNADSTNALGQVNLANYDFTVFLLGRNNAFITSGSGQDAALLISKSTVVVQSLQMRNGQGAGVSASGGSLTMDRCLVAGNAGGGIRLEGTSFDIENTIIALNASVKESSAIYAELGIFTSGNPPPAGGKLVNVSMIPLSTTENAISIASDVKKVMQTTGVLMAAGGGTLTVKSPEFGFCCSGTSTELALASDYSLTSKSPQNASPQSCVGKVPKGTAAKTDYYGTKRPTDVDTNCGAIETISSSAPQN